MFERSRFLAAVAGAVILALSPVTASARDIENPSREFVGLLYSFMAGDPVDFEREARQSPAFLQASEFDRQAVLAREVERRRVEFSQLGDVGTLRFLVRGSFGDYDSTLGGFNLDLFRPNVFLPMGNAGIEFDNREEFHTWKMDVPQARALLGQLQNNRNVVFEVTVAPFAVSTSGSRNVRTQVRMLRIRDNSGRNVLVELKSAQPQRRMAAAGLGTVAPIDNDKLTVLGLKYGSSFADFAKWSSGAGFTPEREFAGGVGAMWVAFAPPSSMKAFNDAKPKTVEEIRARLDSESTAQMMGAISRPQPPFPIMGERMNCLTNVAAEQLCGQVQFGTGDTPATRMIQEVALAQNIYGTNTDAVVQSIVQKFGAYTDQFSGTIGGVVGKHYVWGPSFAQGTGKVSYRRFGNQTRNWPIEAFVVQPENNRIVLVIQINGNPGGPAPAVSAAPTAPRL